MNFESDTERFFRLIQISFGVADRFEVTPDAQQWMQLLDECRRQTITGVVYGGLNHLPEEQRPPKTVLLTWHAEASRIQQRNRQLDHNSVWVSSRFALEGFPGVILKGQGNARLYPDPSLRVAGDVDIWLQGCRDDILGYVLHRFPKQRVQWHEIEFPVRTDTVIEVHTTPSVLFCPTDNRRLQHFYQLHSPEVLQHHLTLPDGEVCVPTPLVNLVFQLTHIYRHLFYEGIGLRQLMDYYLLLRTTEAQSCRDEACAVIRSLHMERFCRAVMWVLGHVFLLPDSEMLMKPDNREGHFLLDEIMRAGNFGLHDKRNKMKSSAWGNFWQITRRNLRFLRSYPREVLWNPPYRIAQYIWRKRKGYR
jgi:hypothetical protein